MSQRSLGDRVDFEVDVPMLNATVDVYLGTFQRTNEKLKEKHGFELDWDTYFKCNDGVVANLEKEKNVANYVMLAVNDFYTKLEDDPVGALGVLSHECIHAATTVMENRGIPTSYENDEVLAYMQEWIFEKVLQRAKRALVKRKEGNKDK